MLGLYLEFIRCLFICCIIRIFFHSEDMHIKWSFDNAGVIATIFPLTLEIAFKTTSPFIEGKHFITRVSNAM